MYLGRCTLLILGMVALSLIGAGCGAEVRQPDPELVTEPSRAATPESGLQSSPLSQFSPLPTATPWPAGAVIPIAIPEPVQLLVLHTNDDWGETEPCG